MRDYEEEETTSTTTTTATATTPAPAPATGASGGGAVLTAHCEITTGADNADNDEEEDNGDDSNPYNDEDDDYHTDDVEDATAAGGGVVIDACVDRYYDHHEDSIERLYHPETEDDDDDDEEFDAPRQRLLQILDYAVHHLATAEQPRELLEMTWKAIRTDWLWQYATPEERTLGVRTRHPQTQLTPLHLICMLDSHPPSDIFDELLQCGGGANNSTHNIHQQDDHVAYWTDAHAYLPLHHACMKGASTDVLRALIHVYPASVLAVDTNQHTPLHLYTTTMSRSDGTAEGGHHGSHNYYTPPETLATNVTLLLGGSCSSSSGGSGTQSSVERGQGDEDNDDTVSSMVEYGAPAQIRTATTGMLPLHYACAYGTTTRVLHVLAKAYPAGLTAQDKTGKTPLHIVMVNAQRSTSPAVLRFLLGYDSEDDEDEDEDLDDNNQKDENEETNNNSILDIARTNSRTSTRTTTTTTTRTTTPPNHAAAILKEKHWIRTVGVNTRDQEYNLPIHLLQIGLRTTMRTATMTRGSSGGNSTAATTTHSPDADEELVQNVSECLKLYLAAEPTPTTDFLSALQHLPETLQDVAVVSPHVRTILNAKIVQRFPTSILLLDGLMLLTMIINFELATIRYIDQLVHVAAEKEDRGAAVATVAPAFQNDEEDTLRVPLILLYTTVWYFFLREAIQVVASFTYGGVGAWFRDTNNWLDVLVITLVTYYSTLMTLGSSFPSVLSFFSVYDDDDDENEDLYHTTTEERSFRIGTALTKGVLWTAVIFFLKSTQVDFAVFLNGVFYVVQRLVAFLLAILVILISFAQMFWIVYLETPVCTFSCPVDTTNNATTNGQCEADLESCGRYPHCEFGDSFLKVYTMMMGEIGNENRYDQNLVAQILYIFYGFFIVILLSNVLIAIVTDSYEIVNKDRAASVFFKNRLDFVAEMDSISSVVRKRVLCINDDDDNDDESKKATNTPPLTNNPTDNDDSESYGMTSPIDGEHINAHSPNKEWLRYEWDSLMSLFEHDVYLAGAEATMESDWVDVFKKMLGILAIPIWLLAGFVTVGILWPPQVREWLFIQKDTTASRAEIERRKLKQLQGIENETKTMKNEIRMEMQNDREEIFRTKAAVDAVQEEILADLQQVNTLVSLLLSQMGGTPTE